MLAHGMRKATENQVHFQITPLSPYSQNLLLCEAIFLPLTHWQTPALSGLFAIWDPFARCFPKEFNGTVTACTGAGWGGKSWRVSVFQSTLLACLEENFASVILHTLESNSARVVLCQLPELPSNWNPLQKIPSCPAQTGTATLVSDRQDSRCTKTARPICPCFTLLLGLLFATFFGAGTWRAPLEGPQVVWRSLSYICHPLELKYNEIYK